MLCGRVVSTRGVIVFDTQDGNEIKNIVNNKQFDKARLALALLERDSSHGHYVENTTFRLSFLEDNKNDYKSFLKIAKHYQHNLHHYCYLREKGLK